MRLNLMAGRFIEQQVLAPVSNLVGIRCIFDDIVVLVDDLIQNADVSYLFIDFLGFAASLTFFL